MKVKLDENLSNDHLEIFQSHGYESTTVHSQGISGCSDRELWNIISKENRMLVTLDLGFADIRRMRGGCPGILLIRTDAPGNRNVGIILKRVLDEIDFRKIKGFIAVADDSKTRIRQ